MTHGYEFFDYDYVDLGDYYTGFEDFMEDVEFVGEWGEIENVYDDLYDDLNW